MGVVILSMFRRVLFASVSVLSWLGCTRLYFLYCLVWQFGLNINMQGYQSPEATHIKKILFNCVCWGFPIVGFSLQFTLNLGTFLLEIDQLKTSW